MFDAYKVAVKLTLVSDVAKQLNTMSNLFNKVGREAEMLQQKLNRLKKVASGLAAGVGVGIFGFSVLKSSMKPGMEYAHQLNIMNMAGMKQQEIAEATAEAWKITGKVITTTATQNLKTILDLRNVFGHTHEAVAYAPKIAEIGAVLMSSTEGKLSSNSSKIAEDIGFSVAKALDIRNAVGNVGEFNREATAMAKVITAFQGRILPEDYRMLFKYGRQAIPGLSNEFLYEQVPTFMLEMKGQKGSGGQGGFGTSLAAFYRFFVQGIMSKVSLARMQEIGLLPMGTDLKSMSTTDMQKLGVKAGDLGVTTTTTGTMLKGGVHVKDVELAQTNPFLYVQNVLLPLIRKKYGNVSNNQLSMIITDLMKGSSQLAQFGVLQMAIKAQNTYRDQAIVRSAMDPDLAYKTALSGDPYLAIGAFHAQMENLKTAFTMGVIPFVIPGMISLVKHLNEFAQWAREHPAIAKNITIAIAAISAALVTFGTILGVRTMFAIISTTAALNALNATLATTAGVAGAAAGMGSAGGYMSGKGYEAAKKATALGAAARFGGYGLLAYGAYELLNSFGAPETSDWMNNKDQLEKEAKQNKQAIINLFVDGYKLAESVVSHIGSMSYQANISNPSRFNLAQSATVNGTHSAI